MRSRVLGSVAVMMLAAHLTALSPAAPAQNKAPAPMKLKIGDMAPDFKLKYADENGLKEINLSQYRGKKNVVVAFYVFAFTGG